jgi:hypothetical protein
MVDPNAIQQFCFKSRLKKPNLPTIEMLITANKQDAAMVIQSAEGPPYCLFANDLFVICDPDHPGGLALYEGGSFFWGMSKSIDLAQVS